MAKILQTSIDAELTVTLQLTESEARALDGIFGYNVDAFLKVFYEEMGAAYLKDHEAGVRSLHETMRSAVAGPLHEIDKARTAVRESLKPKPPTPNQPRPEA